MNNKKVLIIGGVIIFVFLIAVGVLYFVGNQRQKGMEGETSINGASLSDIGNIPVPEIGEIPENESVSVPVSVTEAAKGVSAKLRTFNISAENGKFIRPTVIVDKNDTVHINFTAVDDDYDMTVPDYGLKQVVREGETKPLEFRAEKEGQYVYYCELCGGMNSEAKGYIIVKPSTSN
ncbi:MAG: cupredoxin domain-containing protein [Parcubacteria group bacterium]